jgi:hypothetical protein
MEALWAEADVVFCITLSTRPERRALADASFGAVGLRERVEYLVCNRFSSFRAHPKRPTPADPLHSSDKK